MRLRGFRCGICDEKLPCCVSVTGRWPSGGTLWGSRWVSGIQDKPGTTHHLWDLGDSILTFWKLRSIIALISPWFKSFCLQDNAFAMDHLHGNKSDRNIIMSISQSHYLPVYPLLTRLWKILFRAVILEQFLSHKRGYKQNATMLMNLQGNIRAALLTFS